MFPCSGELAQVSLLADAVAPFFPKDIPIASERSAEA